MFQDVLDRSSLDVPQSLLEIEVRNLAQSAQRDLEARGVKMKDVPLPADLLASQAERRVRLGLILGEVVRAHSLQAKPEQVLAAVEHHAKSFEQPQEVVKWYYSSPGRVREFESAAIEQNVVDWAISVARVEEKPTALEELIGKASA